MIKSPLKAIKANCLECVGSLKEVKLCTAKDCNLFEFRFGKNPYLKRELTEDQRKEAADRMKKNLEKYCSCVKTYIMHGSDGTHCGNCLKEIKNEK